MSARVLSMTTKSREYGACMPARGLTKMMQVGKVLPLCNNPTLALVFQGFSFIVFVIHACVTAVQPALFSRIFQLTKSRKTILWQFFFLFLLNVFVKQIMFVYVTCRKDITPTIKLETALPLQASSLLSVLFQHRLVVQANY